MLNPPQHEVEVVAHPTPEKPESAQRADVLAALGAAGIGEPTRSTLAMLPHVTAEVVTAHARALAKRRGTNNTGLLVIKLRNNEPPPECNCGTCDGCRAQYASSPFSRYFET